jgi:hypothetical protein
MNQTTELHWIDYLIIVIYFCFVLGIGFFLRRFMRTSSAFAMLNATGSGSFSETQPR